MDAYEVQEKIKEAWRQIWMSNPDAAEINKGKKIIPVIVNDREVIDVIIEDEKIRLITNE